MGAGQNNGGGSWLIDYGLEDDVQAADFIWARQIIDDPVVASAVLGLDISQKEDNSSANAGSRKRNRVSSCAGPGTKACREKMRRDKLNDRFLELCSILEPGRPPKADKVAVLTDATRRLNQLRLEAQKLKESNEALKDTIKNLKAEKLELRDEKVRLRTEKDRMEQMLKGTSAPSPIIPHPVAAAAAAAVFHPVAYANCNKRFPYPNYSPIGMWQWIPPAVLDTSQDHVLRPPVA